jgi:type I restriction enzyme R subunit
MSEKEAYARLKIDKMLVDSNWILIDSQNVRKNVICEKTIKLTKNNRYQADYTLLGDFSRPIAIIEAKREGINSLSSKKQARDYAESCNIWFIYLSNGDETYFWDIKEGSPTKVERFLTQKELIDLNNKEKLDKIELWNVDFDKSILAKEKMPYYFESDQYKNENTKFKFLKNNKLIELRDYQEDAIRAVINSASKGNNRFLLEMATGTGKTLTCAAIISIFLQSRNANRVLFLVDRIELENQANNAFRDVFDNGNIFKSIIFKEDTQSWDSSQIVVSTVQTLCTNEKYKELFSVNDFDLIIVDEAHRSISGRARNLFEYFNGYKVGLTATPKNFFKGVDNQKLLQNKEYEYEERSYKDTYTTFGCEPGNPTYSFTLKDGVKKGILVNPFCIDARTELTKALFDPKNAMVRPEGLSLEEEDAFNEKKFSIKNFERDLFSENTNVVLCRSFLREAKRDPISAEIGKTIVYCVSQDHASRIANILNKLARIEMGYDNIGDKFAEQVTSNVKGHESMPTSFSSDLNNLGGNSEYKKDYETSKTRIVVTVGMMTTGYDCKDLLNIVLFRPVYSPSEFIQIKGRGTRIFTFEHEEMSSKKNNFYLFDFMGNCEYFETKFDYDKKLNLPKLSAQIMGNDNGNKTLKENLDLNINDKLVQFVGAQVGIDGMSIDRDFYNPTLLKEKMLKDKQLQQAVKQKDWNKVIAIIKEDYSHKPAFNKFTLKEFSEQYNLNRIPTWKEFVELIYGIRKSLKTKEELVEIAVKKCLKVFNIEEIKHQQVKKLVSAYLDQDIREKLVKHQFNKLIIGAFKVEDLQSIGNIDIVTKIIDSLRTIIPQELLQQGAV